jgi:O-antigen/teichoic acid export membrane protein
MSGERRSAARGVAWGGVESGVTALVGFLLTPLVVRAFGIEGLGLWASAWSLAHAAGILDLGVGASYARFTAAAIATGDTRRLNGTLAAGVGFHLALSGLLGGAALLGLPRAVAWLGPREALRAQAPAILGCALATILLRLTLSAYRGVVAGAQRIDILGRIGAGASLLEGCGAAALILSGCGLRAMALNSLLAAGLASGAEALAAHRLCPGLRVRPFRATGDEWREILAFGLRLQATRAAEILAAHAPRLALAAGPGLATAGAYDLGARVASGIQALGSLPLPVIQPLASRLESRGDAPRLGELLERGTRYVALLALPCAALVLLDAPALLVAWTGRAAPPGAAASARLLALSCALALVASPLRLVLRGLGRPGLEAVASSTGALAQIVLAIGLALPFGAPGVAAAALAGATLAAIVLVWGARGSTALLRSASPRRALSGPLLGAASGLLSGAAARAWLLSATAPLDGRSTALLRLAPEIGALMGAGLLVTLLCRGITRDDLALAREAASVPVPPPAGEAPLPAAGPRVRR